MNLYHPNTDKGIDDIITILCSNSIKSDLNIVDKKLYENLIQKLGNTDLIEDFEKRNEIRINVDGIHYKNL